MNESKIPVRYAKALFLIGKEKAMLEKLSGDVTVLLEFYKNTPAIVPWLRSPIISSQEKKELLRAQFDGQLSEVALRFIDLVITKKRERYFLRIFRNFLDLYKADAGIKTLVITTATPIDEIISQKLSLKFKEKDRPPNELVTRIKPSIIGGFMLQIDDLLYDASISNELKQLKRELTRQVREETR